MKYLLLILFFFGALAAKAQEEEALLKNAEQLIGDAVRKVNRFFATDWAAYRRQVEATRIGLFKDYQPIE